MLAIYMPLTRMYQRMREIASELSQQRSLPSSRHAEAIILQIMREEGIELPAECSVESLAEELRRSL